MNLQVIYFADPMCSWCWGFAPTAARLAARYGEDIPMSVVMGGLFAGNRNPLDERGKATIREHWDHVHEASGQPFDYRFFDWDGFVYDTAPSCRAVVTARRLAPESTLAFLDAVHAAFYRDNRNVTDPATLCEIAAELGFQEKRYTEELFSSDAATETERDFVLTQRAGVRGFPMLLGVRDGNAQILSHGFQPWDTMERIMDHWSADAIKETAER